MTTYDLRERARDLLHALTGQNFLLERITAPGGVLEMYEQVQETLAEVVETEVSATTTNLLISARQLTGEAAAQMRSWPSRRVYRDIEEMEAALHMPTSKRTTAEPLGTEMVARLRQALGEVSERYERFLQLSSRKHTLNLLQALSRFTHILDAVVEVLREIERTISGPEVPEGYESLTLIFDADFTIEEITIVAQATQRIYSELAGLLGVSESEHPLRLHRAEVGSTIIEEIGIGVVIDLMSTFFTAAGSFLLRRVRAKDQLLSIPAKLDEMDRLLHFTERMEEAGMDASIPRSELEKAAVLIAKNLTASIAEHSLVQVNETDLREQRPDRARALRARQPQRLLGDGASPSDAPEESQ